MIPHFGLLGGSIECRAVMHFNSLEALSTPGFRMTWTAADFALILTTLGTLWGVVYPALLARSERKRARIEATSSQFHAALAGCIEASAAAMDMARHQKIAMAAFRAKIPPLDLPAETKRGAEAFDMHLRNLQVLGHRHGIDVANALYLGAKLRIFGQEYDFVEGKLTAVSDEGEPQLSATNQNDFLKAVGEIYLAVDRWVERGKRD